MPRRSGIEASIGRQSALEQIDHVVRVDRPEAAAHRPAMRPAVSGRAARVAVDHRISRLDQHLHLVEHAHAVGGMGARRGSSGASGRGPRPPGRGDPSVHGISGPSRELQLLRRHDPRRRAAPRPSPPASPSRPPGRRGAASPGLRRGDAREHATTRRIRPIAPRRSPSEHDGHAAVPVDPQQMHPAPRAAT